MGNLKSKQEYNKANKPEGYCYYCSSGVEQQIYVILSDSKLLLSLGQGNKVMFK